MCKNKQNNKRQVESNTASVIRSLLDLFDKKYVLPDAVGHMREVFEQRLSNDSYALIKDPKTLATLLTGQVFDILKDKHVRVYYAPDRKPFQRNEKDKRRDEFLRRSNYAFRCVERVSGNIGYLELR